jgi:hypothetical protein
MNPLTELKELKEKTKQEIKEKIKSEYHSHDDYILIDEADGMFIQKTEGFDRNCDACLEINELYKTIEALSLGIQGAEEVLKNEIELLEILNKRFPHNFVKERLDKMKEQLKEEKK